MKDFTKGASAEYLKKTLNLEFSAFPIQEFQLSENINIYKKNVKVIEPLNVLRRTLRNRDEFLFLYKGSVYTNYKGKSTRPKFHISKDCKWVKLHSGFVAANKFPVNVRSRDENITYTLTLEMCKTCADIILKKKTNNKFNWYDAILSYLENPDIPKMTLSNGYISNWNQVSLAYRESVKYTCENPKCKLDLSNEKDIQWLHTHHKNGNKSDNRIDNFEALCYLCHALEHRKKLIEQSGFPEVDEFIALFGDQLNSEIIAEYRKLKPILFRK